MKAKLALNGLIVLHKYGLKFLKMYFTKFVERDRVEVTPLLQAQCEVKSLLRPMLHVHSL